MRVKDKCPFCRRFDAAKSAIHCFRNKDSAWNTDSGEKFPLTYGMFGLLNWIETGNWDELHVPEIEDLLRKIMKKGGR